jgi:hypothetical protein
MQPAVRTQRWARPVSALQSKSLNSTVQPLPLKAPTSLGFTQRRTAPRRLHHVPALFLALTLIRTRGVFGRWVRAARTGSTASLRNAAYAAARSDPRESARCLAMCGALRHLKGCFARWRRFGQHAAVTRYRQDCVSLLRGSSTARHLRGAFHRWMRRATNGPKHRVALRRLQHLAHVSNFRLARRTMRRWHRFCRLQELRRRASWLAMRSKCCLAASSLATWRNFVRRRGLHRRAGARLAVMRRVADLKLLAAAFLKLRALKQRRTVLHAVAARITGGIRECCLRQSYLRWRAVARYRTSHRALAPVRAKAIKTVLRSYLERWQQWTDRRVMATQLEQLSFETLAKRYLRRWRRGSTRLLPTYRRLVHVTSRWRLRQHFARWYRWMERGLRAVQLEQRHFVVTLQRWFIRWRFHNGLRAGSHDGKRIAAPRQQRGVSVAKVPATLAFAEDDDEWIRTNLLQDPRFSLH